MSFRAGVSRRARHIPVEIARAPDVSRTFIATESEFLLYAGSHLGRRPALPRRVRARLRTPGISFYEPNSSRNWPGTRRLRPIVPLYTFHAVGYIHFRASLFSRLPAFLRVEIVATRYSSAPSRLIQIREATRVNFAAPFTVRENRD